MTGPDPIADSLPPPRDDEPADLRCDIIDELNDHLDCAVQRELLRGKDETDARRSAIQLQPSPLRFDRPQRERPPTDSNTRPE